MATVYNVEFIHKFSNRSTGKMENVATIGHDLSTKTLGRALRQQGFLAKGQRVLDYRHSEGKIVVFPRCKVFHSLILTVKEF